jgi:protein TonB
MFETVAPEKFLPRSRKLYYETLPVSLAAHGLVVGVLLFSHIWKVEFPIVTPKLVALYSLEAMPTPPPPPPPPAAAARRQPVPDTPRPVRMEEVAPTVIPDFIPLVPPTETLLPPVEGVIDGVEGGVEGGVVGGSITGVEGGTLGGVEGGTVGGVGEGPPPDTVVVKRDMPLPTAPMSMVFPKYPEEARVRGWEDMVVVRYIIGKNGRVREVIVLDHPQRELFEKVTVKAIKNWRFRPHKVDGVAQEVIHELTIYFRLEA